MPDDVKGTDDEDTVDGVPTGKPKSATAWLAAITAAEKDFRDYQDRADNIDRQYANLERLASTTRDRQFQLFWANIQVLGPSIYSRPPAPVVVPRFKERKPLARTASELLERACTVAFELEDIDAIMRLVRDDMVVLARGCVWLRYETKTESGGEHERVCIEHVHRKDFLHQPARNWKEVGWIAKRSWMARRAMRKRFLKTSGDAYKSAAFEVRKDENDTDDGTLKAGVWEVWDREAERVLWVSEGCDKLLDDDKPHLALEGFYPCPRPAYGTLQRGSLVPVPDMVFYKDQLEEINELTSRVAALTEAVKLRGFYPSGAGEIGDAVEAAVKSRSDNVVLVPVSNWAMVGNGGVKDMIVWLPLDMIVSAIKELVELRRQLIEDVYQVTGLSDIMRGATEASETLGAQQLKSQYGSIRIRDRQEELVRLARDVTRITAEIKAENFAGKTLVDMAQMDIPSDRDIAAKAKPLKDEQAKIRRELAAAQRDPEIMAMAQERPEEAQRVMGEAQERIAALDGEIAKLDDVPTVESLTKFLRDQRIRPFVLDIETDSTIAPDENAQKQRATEYLTAMGGLMAQAMPVLQQFPQAAPLLADTIRFAQAQFRVGRQMDQTVDEFVDAMKALAQQPPADPNAGAGEAAQAAQAAQQADAAMKQADMQMRQQEVQAKGQLEQARLQMELQGRQAEMEMKGQLTAADMEAKRIEAQARMGELEARRAADAERHGLEMQKGALDLRKIEAEIARIEAQTAGAVQAATANAAAKANGAAT